MPQIANANCLREVGVSETGAQEFVYQCSGDLDAFVDNPSSPFVGVRNGGLLFRDGDTALLHNSEIRLHSLTARITPEAGTAGLLALNFASPNQNFDGLIITLEAQPSLSGSYISTTGTNAHGVATISNGNGFVRTDNLLVQNVTNGGSASGITIETVRANPADSGSQPFIIRTNGVNSHGIFARSLGGNGANGSGGGNGLDAGTGGAVFIENTAYIETSGDASIAILGESLGGTGGTGSGSNPFSSAGNGGRGGLSREVEIENYYSLVTYGDDSHGIVARSLGGRGGDGGDGVVFAGGGSGGATSNGFISAIDNAGSVFTYGDFSHGLLSQSIGGFGGSGGSSDGFVGYAGDGRRAGNGSLAQAYNLTNGHIRTNGDFSNGMTIQSIGGGGGNGGSASGLGSIGGTGNTGGAGGIVRTENEGLIETKGDFSNGIQAQSIGGGGGDGGNSSGFVSIGGSGASTSYGGLVQIHQSGSITTEGDDSNAVLAQSIGGGGGTGGSSNSTFLGIGGSGGGGGNGGSVYYIGGGTLSTLGDNASGILAQSIGGGGGNGGNARGTGSFNLNIGGSGGFGGDAAFVDIKSGYDAANFFSAAFPLVLLSGTGITTQGDRSHGIHGQSVGGGGGNGGYATSLSGSPVGSFAAAFGGSGGAGGHGGVVDIKNRVYIQTNGNDSSAILAQSIGGGGGNGGFALALSGSNGFSGSASFGGSGGNGGNSGAATITNTGSIVTAGERASALVSQSVGGGGGNGGYAISGAASGTASLNLSVGGSGGSGGIGRVATVDNIGSILTQGAQSNAIVAQSIGGGGGDGGFAIGASFSGGYALNGSIGGSAGTGGIASKAVVTNSGAIDTLADDANGILAQSIGGGGGNGGFAIGAAGSGTASASLSIGGSGGTGGNAGQVNLTNSGVVFLRGKSSRGLVAQSIGGGGGNGGFSVNGSASANFSGGLALGGSGSAGGDAAAVNINNSGIITTGFTTGLSATDATAILAQSIGGGGGNGGFSTNGSFSRYNASFSIGGAGSSGGNAARVDVTNAANLTTNGHDSFGILAQSIGGGGGNGGFSVSGSGSTSFSGNLSLGGSSSNGGNASVVFINNQNANVITQGNKSTAVATQSIGGGGGNGGFSVGSALGAGRAVNASVGGSGSGGGTADDALIASTGNVTTVGDESHGFHAQSIGGGGGNGGFSIGATGSRGHSGTLSVGGSGGSGARSGSTASVNSTGNILTQGDKSIGIFSQSIGGGGGNGGFALSGNLAVGNAIAGSIGGNGGSGGTSGYSNAISVGDIRTEGDDASAILVQSIGGGGGNGGFSFAGSSAVNSNSIGFSLGGVGTVGGNAGQAALQSNGDVVTLGTASDALVVQSIGGGGGNAGFSGTLTGTMRSGSNIGLSLGGNGGSGGFGGVVSAVTDGSITTYGFGSTALLTQSIGGGGGNGGHGYNAALSSGSGGTVGSIVFGGTGGNGGYAQTVTVTNDATITTNSKLSNGIVAQSIGGGGGYGGTVINGNLSPRSDGNQVGVALGGDGGSGGAASNVSVTNNDFVLTYEDDSIAILAQSIGGGGGSGGSSIGVGLTGPDASNYGLSIGGSGGIGNTAGDITINHTGSVVTGGSRAHGIFTQSVGGGGGNGGISGAIALGTGGNNSGYAASIGGSGGTGGTAGNIDITTDGSVVTQGINAHAVFAQSIGGGGGNGASSVAATRTGDNDDENRNIAVSVAIGGNGGTGNHAGDVNITNNDTIQTLKSGSYGLYAQAIGGGGGSGGNSNAFTVISENEDEADDNTQNKSRTLSVGGDGGASGHGGEIDITNTGTIQTILEDSHAIVVQSIGGGGGNGGDAAHAKPTLNDMFALPNAPSFPSIPGFNYNFNPEVSDGDSEVPQLFVDTDDLSITVGGSGGASGNGDTVTIDNQGTIVTQGAGSFGILAQSIGGGGGIGGLSESGQTGTIGVGGAGGAAGHGGNVRLTNSGNISTQGMGAHAIFVQSIGGGGGLAGNIDRGITDDNTTGLALGRSGGGGGNGGNIDITSSGTITTQGDAAYGIFAQSIGGGGGVAGSIGDGPGFAGSTGAIGDAGIINIQHTGNITTYGDNAHGIYAQAYDGSGSEAGEVNITYDGDITVHGSGSEAIVVNAKDGCTANCNLNITLVANNIITGSSDGAGVSFRDGHNNLLTNNARIQSLGGISGFAIKGTSGDDVVQNNSHVFGSVDLGGGLNRFVNNVASTFEMGRRVNLGGSTSAYRLVNSGDVDVGGTGTISSTQLTGNFIQDAGARLLVDIDTSTFNHDQLIVSGSANLDGELVLNNITPGQTLAGRRVARIVTTGQGVNADNLTFTQAVSSVVDFNVQVLQGNDLAVVTDVDFNVQPTNSNPNQQSLGGYFNQILFQPTPELEATVAAITSLKTDEEVAAFFSQLMPETQASSTAGNVISSVVFNQRLRSCHQRTGVNKFVREGQCSWFAVGGSAASRDNTGDAAGYKARSYNIASGVQYEVDDGWYIGAGMSYEMGSSESTASTASQDRKGGQLGVIVKREMGNTLLTGTVAGGVNFHDSMRVIDLGASTDVAYSDYKTGFASLEIDAAHTFDQGKWYYRPVIGANYTHTRSSSFKEHGADGNNIIANSSSENAFFIRAGIDAGYEFDVGDHCSDDCTLLRPYMRVGYVKYLTDEEASLDARLQGATTTDTFTVSSPAFEDFIDLNLGLEILHYDNTVIRVDYGGQFGEDFDQHSVLLKASLPF